MTPIPPSIAMGFRTILAACPKCGNPAPINGLVEKPECPECLSRIELPRALWENAFYMDGLETLKSTPGRSKTREVTAGGLALRVERIHLGSPACPSCEAPLPTLPEGPGGVPAPSTCPACGVRVEPHPPALPATTPEFRIRYVLSTETDAAPPPAGAPSAAGADAAAPVVMTCPRCTAALEVTAGSERTVPCTYCKASVYLPDDLWRKLHPVKTAALWTAVLDYVPSQIRRSAMAHFWGVCAGLAVLMAVLTLVPVIILIDAWGDPGQMIFVAIWLTVELLATFAVIGPQLVWLRRKLRLVSAIER